MKRLALLCCLTLAACMTGEPPAEDASAASDEPDNYEVDPADGKGDGVSATFNKNNVVSAYFRSGTQATDSTCNGCQANNPATIALLHSAPVMRRNNRKRRMTFAICSARLIR